jgi:hypothetical protein
MSIQAFENFELDKGYDVSGAIDIFHFVKGDGVGGVTQVTSAADHALGVSQFHVTVSELARGKGASVRGTGISQVYVSGTPALGDFAGLQADGTVRVAQSGDRVVGLFRSSGVDGGKAAVQVELPGHILP